MIKNIRHTGIVVEDKEKSLEFYRDLLGFEIVKEANEKGSFISEISGSKKVEVITVKMKLFGTHSMIELLEYKKFKESKWNKELPECGVRHLALTVKNLNKLYQKLKEKNIPFLSEPKISNDGKAKVCFCVAPEGSYIELVEEL